MRTWSTTGVEGKGPVLTLAGPRARAVAAFTLTELLIVIGIIGILAAIGLPALRGLGESNAIDAATRQMLDDLGYARLRAINDRTTVYLLFVPPDAEKVATNLAPYRLTTYALFSRRSLGEQPGRHTPRQLTPWRSLPDRTFFPLEKFSGDLLPLDPSEEAAQVRPLAWTNNFSLVITNRLYPSVGMNYLAFNANGQLVRFGGDGKVHRGEDQLLAIAKGNVFHPQDAASQYTDVPDVVEIPKGNRRYIKINWLTGRASVRGDLDVDSGAKRRLVGNPE